MNTLTRKKPPNTKHQAAFSLIQYLAQYYRQLHWHRDTELEHRKGMNGWKRTRIS